MTIPMTLRVAGLILVTSTTPVSPAERPSDRTAAWPTIAPSKGTVQFARGGKAAIDVSILGANGVPLYILRCLTVESEPADSRANYTGDFECRMLESDAAADGLSMLHDSESVTEWDSRGRFNRQELEGACAVYPEYGRVRHFRLRGLELALELSEVAFRTTGDARPMSALRSFRFSWSVIPAADALSERAELPKVRNPYHRSGDGAGWVRECGEVKER